MPRKKTEIPQEVAVNNLAHLVLNKLQHVVNVGKLPEPEPGLNDYEKQRVRRLTLEVTRRSFEALRIYEPMPLQQAFHRSMAKERIYWGANQSGKTTVCMVELARALTGQDPHNRYPKENGVCYLVGFDGKHMADPLWKKLARPGPFDMIRDLETKQWRAFRQYEQGDLERMSEARPAPPLIPKRFIADIGWEDKKRDQPAVVKFVNGWTLHMYSGNAKPAQGTQIDIGCFDEEIPDAGEFGWYSEIAARLIRRRGWFMWGATPLRSTEKLLELHDRAEKEAADPEAAKNPSISEFRAFLWENRHMTREQKLEFISKMSDEERRVRVDAEFAIMGATIFPEYREAAHGVDYFDIPQEWTRYAAIDPGRQTCAVLFMAIPPPSDPTHGGHAYCYDELYLRNCDADTFGQRMGEKARNQRFQAFLIDDQEARKAEAGSGKSIEEWYSDALRKHNCESIETKFGFYDGSKDRRADVEAIRLWLKPMDGKQPKLRIMIPTCPNLHRELRKWRYKKVSKQLTDTPEDRGDVHLCATLRYLVQHDPKWVSRVAGPRRPSYAEELLRKRMANRPQQPLVMLGPVGG